MVNNISMQPIRIAGAGPSGLATAITLAKAGWPVEVYERNADVGGRFNGDLQGLWEKFRHRRNERVVQQIGRSTNPFRVLRSFYNFNIMQRLLYPFVRGSVTEHYTHHH